MAAEVVSSVPVTAREIAERSGLPALCTYSAPETAAYTGIPYHRVLDAIHDGELRASVRRGGKRGWRVRPEDVDAWLAGGAA